MNSKDNNACNGGGGESKVLVRFWQTFSKLWVQAVGNIVKIARSSVVEYSEATTFLIQLSNF